jgi:DNA-binding transcriptional regulator GbsR (MarR family)
MRKVHKACGVALGDDGTMNRDISDIRKHIVDACVQAARLKGYSDASGVLRGTLFLSDKPLSMDDLVMETGYSKSTVSANMSILENLGLAKRVITPGDKRYHYVSVSDVDSLRTAMVTNVKKELQLILSALDLTERDLKSFKGCEVSDKAMARLSYIRHFYKQTERLLDLMANYSTEELIDILDKARK